MFLFCVRNVCSYTWHIKLLELIMHNEETYTAISITIRLQHLERHAVLTFLHHYILTSAMMPCWIQLLPELEGHLRHRHPSETWWCCFFGPCHRTYLRNPWLFQVARQFVLLSMRGHSPRFIACACASAFARIAVLHPRLPRLVSLSPLELHFWLWSTTFRLIL